MKTSMANVATVILPFILHLVKASIGPEQKVSKGYNPLTGYSKPRFISFNSEDGKIDIDWDITIPFISIPLDTKPGGNGEISPLFEVNTKAIGLAGLVTTIITLIVPLFSKIPHPELNYRSDGNVEWSQMRSSINEIIFGNNYVTPCMQRIVCSIVSLASRSESPSSTEKIIDGLSSHKWFKEATNGTIIQEAVIVGREGKRDCAHVYKNCLITPRLLKTIANQFGIA